MLKNNYKKIILVIVILFILQYFIPFHLMKDRENLDYMLISYYSTLLTNPKRDEDGKMIPAENEVYSDLSDQSYYSDEFKNNIYDILSESSMYKVFPLFNELASSFDNNYDYYTVSLHDKEKNSFDRYHYYDIRITLSPDENCYVFKDAKKLYRISKKDSEILKSAFKLSNH